MKSPDSGEYLDLLTNPVVDVLDQVDGVIDPLLPPPDRLTTLQRKVLESVSLLDWEQLGLADHDFGKSLNGDTGEDTMAPREYAKRLISFAFGDCYNLIHFCVEHANRTHMPIDDTFAEIVKRSKGLLVISYLEDQKKRELVNGMVSPDFMDAYTGISELDGPSIRLAEDAEGKPFFDLHPKIKNWVSFQREFYPEAGCPANKKIIVNKDGRRQVLTRFFWDKTVEALFG